MALLDLLSSGFLTSKGVTSTTATGSMSNATQADSSFLTTKGNTTSLSMTGSGASVSQANNSFYTSKGVSSGAAGQPNYLQTIFTNTVK
jgi:hypothetical protein